jgi:hypothetical protein
MVRALGIDGVSRARSAAIALLLAGSIAVSGCSPCAGGVASRDPQPAARTPFPSDAPPVPPQRYPPAIAPPQNVACALTKDVWPHENNAEGLGIHYLRFVPGGAPFARIHGGTDVELRVPAALASAGAHLRIYTSGVWLEGHIEATELPLYAASPVVLSGVFVPDHNRRLVWRSARPGKITVTADAGPRVRLRDDGLVAELDCAQIAIGSGTIEPPAVDALIKAPRGSDNLVKPWLLLKPGVVELSALPGGKAVVDIDVVEPRDDSVLIQPMRLLGTEKAWSRVTLSPYGGVLFGWVRTDALLRTTKDHLDLSHDTYDVVMKKQRVGAPLFACPSDLPLYSEAGGEQRLVGRVRAGTAFERLGVKGEWTSVDFPRLPLAPAPDASLLLETRRQSGCGPAPPPKTDSPEKSQ